MNINEHSNGLLDLLWVIPPKGRSHFSRPSGQRPRGLLFPCHCLNLQKIGLHGDVNVSCRKSSVAFSNDFGKQRQFPKPTSSRELRELQSCGSLTGWPLWPANTKATGFNVTLARWVFSLFIVISLR